MMYAPKDIEAKWKKVWSDTDLYRTDDDVEKEKYYILDMFPYPSGEGLHVGHPKGYIATDVIARQKMMEGKSVLHPMGWDAFGLPAENYAIKNKVNPNIAVKENVARFKKQLETFGFTYDWSREVNTTDPAYYKWTQWIFLKLFEKGLAYESFEPINWCPSCKTGLANEDLEDGRCERCGSIVEKKPMRQWVLRITDYADRLLKDLDTKILDTGDFVETLPNNEKSFVQMTTASAVRPDQPFIERQAVAAIVEHWDNDSCIVLKWKKVDWSTLITGGVEKGQSPEEAARAEIFEETGYKNLRLVKQLNEQVHGTFFHVPKNENRFGHFTCFHFKLENDEQVPISADENEKHEIHWVKQAELQKILTASSHQYMWSKLMNEPFVLKEAAALLDWPESIKESQRNWIGRSEGAEIDFNVRTTDTNNVRTTDTTDELIGTDTITVFTTRPDTLFGVSYVVLAPEHPLIHELEGKIKNLKAVKKYIEEAAAKTEIDRTSEGREQSGIELEGLSAINPINNEVVPIWIADYVLADYGTGAVMAVPAHDERDFRFAKKYNLPIKQVIAPETGIKGEDEKVVKGGCAFVFDSAAQKYAIVEQDNGFMRLCSGNVADGEDEETGILREVIEESGLHDFAYTEKIADAYPHYYNTLKKSNRAGWAACYLVILKSAHAQKQQLEEHEKFDLKWVSADELGTNWESHNQDHGVDHWLWFLEQSIGRAIELGYDKTSNALRYTQRAYIGSGKLINSGKYTGINSEEAKKEIIKAVGGQVKVRYRLRDWVFSRQRYWGEPIPIIHCEDCGAVGVPEKDLPVTLPEVEFYEPTGTGESPLAAISDWVTVACPTCGKTGKRETNTMPQWAGSSWYYLRYIDPKNDKTLVDKDKETHWSPVDVYVGGAEHATRHLIYARFWHKFLYDSGVVSYPEPFKRYTNLGLILAADGRKMSKRWGNVINPDDMIAKYGADAFRIYEMFLSPFTQSASFLESGVAGAKSFLNRIFILLEKVSDGAKKNEAISVLLNQTIKKVGDDINTFKFNTAISALMILSNALTELEFLDAKTFGILVQLLAPFAPHAAEELWQGLGNTDSIFKSQWPSYDASQLVDETATIAVQVNARLRDTFEINREANEDEIKKTALKRAAIQKWIDGKEIKKIIVVKGRVVNIVV